ncbi:MAG TPA: hypothetical protein VFO48_02685 [Vicinamibacterales bacterium]|nr:hypothetical protein [Vicinamibacterales bacterium]
MKPILLMLCAMLLPMDVLAQTTPVQADGSRFVAMAGVIQPSATAVVRF